MGKYSDGVRLVFGLFILIVVILVIICVGNGEDDSQSFSYTLPHSRKRSGEIRKSRDAKKSPHPTEREELPKRQHPVLEYQRQASRDTVPANYGDQIRFQGSNTGPSPSRFRTEGGKQYAYPLGGGPYPGGFLGVPVQQGNLKISSERYGAPFYYQNNPLISYDFFKPYGPNSPSMQNEVNFADIPFYNKPSRGVITGDVPFVGSADSFAPFPEVDTKWEKVGIIQTVNPNNNAIMNIFRKHIAPLQDLFQYTVQDKNGFVVPLKETYLEDGDIIESVPGRESLGKWKFNDYVKYKYIWM